MKLKKLLSKLQKIYDKHGDIDVSIDVEARCFNYHFVGVERVVYEPVDKEMVLLIPDYYNAPPNIYDNDLNEITEEQS